MNLNQTAVVMESMGLPKNLVRLIATGRLHAEIERAYKVLDELNAAQDAFEAEYPELAAAVPWFSAREVWKAQGRPRPEWYEALLVLDGRCTQTRRCFRNFSYPYAKVKTPRNAEKWRTANLALQRRKRIKPTG
jgi:hypothetical protein